MSKRNAEHQQEVAHRERRIRRLRDEHHGERQVDRKGVEIEGVAGGNDEPYDRLLHANSLELAHDLRQHRVGGRGGQNDGQFLAQVGQELEDVQAGDSHHRPEDDDDEDRDRDVEQHDQRNQLLERSDAVAADGIGDGAKHAEWSNPDDQPHRLEQHGRDRVDEGDDFLTLFADQGEADPKDDREEQYLQHVVASERVDRRGGNDVQNEAADSLALQLVRIGGVRIHRPGIELRRIDVHAVAGAEDVSERDSEHQGDGGHGLEVDQGLDADPADLLEVAGPRDAVHDDAEHDWRDDHRNQLQKSVAQKLELDREVRHRHAQHDAQQQRGKNLNEERLVQLS